jgi:hypothetical protein
MGIFFYSYYMVYIHDFKDFTLETVKKCFLRAKLSAEGKNQSSDLTKAHVIVNNMRENRAPAGDSDRFSRTYGTIARLLIA